MGSFKEMSLAHNGIFHPINLCHTFSVTLLPPLYHSLKDQIMEREKRRFCVYMTVSAYRVIPKQVES